MRFFDTNVLVYAAVRQDERESATAEKLGCTEIVSEDLNDGQLYHGMAVVNPFKSAV